MSWQVLRDPAEVLPLDDLREHEEGVGCWCRPTVDEGVIVHHSMDGREQVRGGSEAVVREETWTDDQIAELRRLWTDGLSTAAIGRKMKRSKNSVVGKAHRLGLPERPSPIRPRRAAAPRSPQRVRPLKAGSCLPPLPSEQA